MRDHTRSRDRASQCIGMMAKRRGIESNLRHKLLGDSLETLAFAVFAFETFQTRVQHKQYFSLHSSQPTCPTF